MKQTVKPRESKSRTYQSQRRPAHSKNSKRTRQETGRFDTEQVMAMIAEYYDQHIAPYLEDLASTKPLRQSEQDRSNPGTGGTQ